MNGLSRRISRVEGRNIFELASSGAECLRCEPRPSGDQFIIVTNISITNIAFRFDYALFGNSSPYIAALGGISGIDGVPDSVAQSGNIGGVVGARLGYRYRLIRVLEVAAEGGWQGQFYEGGRVNTISLQALLRFYL
jgi:hypothetical protein